MISSGYFENVKCLDKLSTKILQSSAIDIGSSDHNFYKDYEANGCITF